VPRVSRRRIAGSLLWSGRAIQNGADLVTGAVSELWFLGVDLVLKAWELLTAAFEAWNADGEPFFGSTVGLGVVKLLQLALTAFMFRLQRQVKSASLNPPVAAPGEIPQDSQVCFMRMVQAVTSCVAFPFTYWAWNQENDTLDKASPEYGKRRDLMNVTAAVNVMAAVSDMVPALESLLEMALVELTPEVAELVSEKIAAGTNVLLCGSVGVMQVVRVGWSEVLDQGFKPF
jgi:hypothetical protein